MFSIARIFEVMVATAFYSGLVYMFYDGTGTAPGNAVVTKHASSSLQSVPALRLHVGTETMCH